jgi:Flp pilus assembly pilin Flp
MVRMRAVTIRFIRDSAGATAIEYTLIVAILGAALMAALGLLQDDFWTVFTDRIGSALTGAGAQE